MPPVIMEPEDRTKVTAAQSQTTLRNEWRRVRGGPVRHNATLRYTFRNVLATPSGFFVDGHGFARFGRLHLQRMPFVRITRVPKGFFACKPICSQYFGHWLGDALPLTLLAQKGEALYLPYDPRWSHAPAYLDLLGIVRIPDDYVLFDEMTFCVDVGQNENRRSRTRQIRERIHAAIAGVGNKSVYLKRGNTGERRRIINEDELVAALKAEGFSIVSIDAPLSEILRECRGAETIISVEGSHMWHGLYAAAEGALHVTLNPADRFNNVFADYIPALRSRLGTIVMERAGTDYRVDVPHTLDFLRRHSTLGGKKKHSIAVGAVVRMN